MATNQQEQKAVLTLCLSAAFADGAKDEREREQIKQIAESLSTGTDANLPALYQEVLLNAQPLEVAAAQLTTPEIRKFAYEMAVCVCDADGAQTAAETAFLEQLRSALQLESHATSAFNQQADLLANAPFEVRAIPVTANKAELDEMILNYALMNGALELLPQSLASMAILPLQTKMVYRIGKAYGYELDRGHIKDFAATLGIGFTGQYVEQMGRKLIGGLLDRIGGGLLGGIGGLATGASFSFATTYALGQVAVQYYAGGRTINLDQLKQTFAKLVEQGRALQGRYTTDIQQKARSLDLSQLPNMLRQL